MRVFVLKAGVVATWLGAMKTTGCSVFAGVFCPTLARVRNCLSCEEQGPGSVLVSKTRPV